MAERKNPPEKISLEEAFRRIRPAFIMMMMFPLFGLVAAMIVVYVMKIKNLLLIEGLLLLAMVIYVVTTWIVAKKMSQLAQRVTLEREKEPLQRPS